MTNSVQYLFYLALSLYAWHLKLFQKVLIKNVPTNILNSVTSLKFKKKTSSNKICNHDKNPKGPMFLHGSLAAVFAYGELTYDPVKKRQLLPEALLLPSVINSVISLNYSCFLLWPTILGIHITHSRLHATRISLLKRFFLLLHEQRLFRHFLTSEVVMNLPKLLHALLLPLALKQKS